MRCEKCGHSINESSNFCENCGTSVEKLPQDRAMRSSKGKKKIRINKKRFIGAVLCALVVCVAVIAAVMFTTQDDSKEEIRLVNAKTKEYLLLDVDKDFEVEVKGIDGRKPTYRVTDLDGKTVAVNLKAEGGKSLVVAPKGGYIPGEIYEISLDESTVFVNPQYKQAKILSFKVYRRQAVKIEYTNNVIKLKKGQVSLKGDSIETEESCKSGDILIADQGPDKEAVACKIGGVIHRKSKAFAHYETPKIDEVYKNIDINKTIISDESYLSVKKDAAIEAAKQFGALNEFIDAGETLTADDVNVKVTQSDKDTIQVDLAIKDPADKTRVIKLRFSVKYEIRIEIKDQRQFMDSKLKFTDNVKVSVKGKESQAVQEKVEKNIAKFEKDNRSALKKNKKKGSNGFLNIFSVKVPIEGTICFYSDFGLNYQLQASGITISNLTAGVSADQGILIQNGKVRKRYANVDTTMKGSLLLQGRMDHSIGLTGEFGAQIVEGTGIIFKVAPQIYNDMKGYLLANDASKIEEAKGRYDVEAGIKMQSEAIVQLHYLSGKVKYKKSLLNVKSHIAKDSNITRVENVNMKKKYGLKDGKVNLKQLKATYVDIIEEEKTTRPIEKYSLYVDGKKVEVNGGFIQSTVTEGDHIFKIRWRYKTHRQEYEQPVEIVKSFDLNVVTAAFYQNQFGPFPSSGGTNTPYYSNVNIVIPEVGDTTENAQACNAKINKYCSVGIEMADALRNNTQLPANYGEISTFSTYSWSYETHKYKDVTALVISTTVRGNQWGGWDAHYALYYDNSTGQLMSPEDYAEEAGYSAEAVMDLAGKGSKSDRNLYVPSNIGDFQDKGTTFYVDGSGILHVKYGFSQ